MVVDFEVVGFVSLVCGWRDLEERWSEVRSEGAEGRLTLEVFVEGHTRREMNSCYPAFMSDLL